MKYAFYTDPSHGWLKVLIEEIVQLGIARDISSFSYVSPDRKWAYLEEDMDAQTYIRAVLSADWFQDMNAIRASTRNIYSERPCYVRNFDSFDFNEFIKEPVDSQIQIHFF
jgi:hypothetical protein